MPKRNHVLGNRLLALAAGTAALTIMGSTARANLITWNGGTGNWSNGADWSGGSAPAGGTTTTPSTFSAEIDANPSVSSVVTYDETLATVTSGELTVDAGDELLVPTPSTGSLGALTLGYTSSTSAGPTLSNSGMIDVSDTKAFFIMTFAGHGTTPVADAPANSGIIEVSGGGEFELSGVNAPATGITNTGGLIAVTGAKSTLELVGVPIVYGGTITSDTGSTITTDSFSNQAIQFTNAIFTNAGTTQEYTNSAGVGSAGDLIVNGASTINNSGTMSVYYNGASSSFKNQLVIGGAWISQSGVTSTTSNTNLVNTGQLNVTDACAMTTAATTAYAQLVLSTTGTIDNDGAINITNTGTGVAWGSTASINIGQNTLIGNSAGKTGTIVFNDSVGNYVGYTLGFTGSTAPVLTLGSGQTLSGAVLLGNGQIGITNHGTIHANGVNPIVISTAGGNSFYNDGTLQVDNGSKIQDTDSSLVLSSGSNVAIAIDSNTDTSGLINVTGALDLTANPTLTVTDIGSTVLGNGVIFTLIDPSSITGTFAGYAEGSTYSLSPTENFIVSYKNNEVTLTSMLGVPEPASLSLLALGALGLLHRRRREIA